jgi:hypothetical protein
MPPRIVTVTIILFWLATTGALVYYEMAPRFRAGEPPPFTIPMTAEVSENSVRWNVLSDDLSIGDGSTQIKRLPDRTYQLSAQFNIKRFKVLFIGIEDLTLTSKYHITDEGNLLGSEAHAKFTAVKVPVLDTVPVEFDFKGEVKEHHFHPQLTVRAYGKELESPELEPFPVSESGNILNPMHLVHKISGLRAGRSWRIPLMDPMRAIPARLRPLAPTKDLVVDELTATVSLDDLSHHGVVEPCYKIEYSKAEDSRPSAATWVRRRDDAVLQQWARHEGIEYTLQRAREH